MQQVKRISIEGFRGIRRTLALEPEGRSLFILAENSQGKSSVADATEWFFCKDHIIERLRGEGTDAKDYQHLLVGDAGGESTVTVKFKGSSSALTKKLKTSESLIPEESDPASFAALYKEFVVPPCLRYIDVARFVLETKGKKYEILARWMGFEDLMEEQLRLRNAHEVVRQHLKALENDIKLRKEQIKKTTSRPNATDQNVLAYANELLKGIEAAAITTRKELREKIGVLQQRQFSVRGEREFRLASFDEQTTTLLFKDHSAEVMTAATQAQGIESDIASNPRLRVDVLYQAGLSVLVDASMPLDACPLCDTPWQRTTRAGREALVTHIRQEIEKLETIKTRKRAHDQLVNSLLSKLQEEYKAAETLEVLLSRISDQLGYCYVPVHTTVLRYQEKISTLTSLLQNRKWQEAKAISLTLFRDMILAAKNDLKVLLEQERNKLTLTQEERKMNDALAKLEEISRQYDGLHYAIEKLAFATTEAEKFEVICQGVDSALQESVQTSFQSVSSLIQKYFEILRPASEPHNQISDIQLKLHQAGRAAGRAVEVDFTFHNRESISPPRKVMTESHLNALGISIYLALAKHLNTSARFLLLDDVINSLDMAHRYNFVKLLSDEFVDFQLFVFTHDEICFTNLTDRMKTAVPMKLKGWSFDDGPQLDEFTTSIDLVQKHLDDGDPTEAMRALGRHIERRLHIFCERVGARTRHCYFGRSNHTIGELFNALENCCKDELHCDQPLRDSFDDTKISGKMRNFFFHDFEKIASGISSPEVQTYRDEWIIFEQEFFCLGCKEFVHRPILEKFAICKCRAKQIPTPPVVSQIFEIAKDNSLARVLATETINLKTK